VVAVHDRLVAVPAGRSALAEPAWYRSWQTILGAAARWARRFELWQRGELT
jgi:hypothetical protein